MKAYCVKCKAETDMTGAAESDLKNGRKAIKGKCSKCGTGMFKMLGKTETATPRQDASKPTIPKPRRGPLGVRV